MTTLRQRWLNDWAPAGLVRENAWLERLLASYATPALHARLDRQARRNLQEATGIS